MSRFISMADFRNGDAAAECIKLSAKGQKGAGAGSFPLGQVIGHVSGVREKVGEERTSGQPNVSYMASGEFEAVVYAHGDVAERILKSGAIYLPKYYAQELQAAFTSGNMGSAQLLFGIEISMVPTGNIALPYAYECDNITGVTRSAPLQRLKAYMAKAGTLRLPPPDTTVTLEEVTTGEGTFRGPSLPSPSPSGATATIEHDPETGEIPPDNQDNGAIEADAHLSLAKSRKRA